MKIIVIDRDEMFLNRLSGKIRAAGHDVIESTVKQGGIDKIGTQHVDAIYLDPAPLSDARSVLLQIRRMIHNLPYIVLIGQDVTTESAIKVGCNEALSKPLDGDALLRTLDNAQRMSKLINRLGDVSYDFPSAGGVIAKSAFNQLFLSAMDRVSRYDETSRALFIAIKNYDDLKLDEGKFAADQAVSQLAQNLGRLRRQSDILGQTNTHEYALLLQRPQNENEALDAAKRFALAIERMTDLGENIRTGLRIEISLIDLPSGELEFHCECNVMGHALGAASIN